MAYLAHSTQNNLGVRPWNARLSGLGDYQRARFFVPTTSADLPADGMVTGGLGFDLSTIPTWAYVAGGAVALFLFFGGSKRHRRRA
jgi:hypothetical protein